MLSNLYRNITKGANEPQEKTLAVLTFVTAIGAIAPVPVYTACSLFSVVARMPQVAEMGSKVGAASLVGAMVPATVIGGILCARSVKNIFK